MLSSVVLSAALISGHALASIPTVEIAPGVDMPVVNHGVGDQSVWLEVGGRGMDTALNYGDDAQGDVGKNVKSELVARSDLFVTTKVPCCPASFWSKDTCQDLRPVGGTGENIDSTLSKIGIPQADLLILHWPCDKFEDTLTAYSKMEEALADGKVRAIGVSNFNYTLLQRLVENVKVKPALTQNAYSVGHHSDIRMGADIDTLDFCRENGITFSAWAPLGGVTRTSETLFKDPVIKAIAEDHGKSVPQIALRWLIQQGIVPVTGGSNEHHLREDLDIFDFELSGDEMKRLAEINFDLAALV